MLERIFRRAPYRVALGLFILGGFGLFGHVPHLAAQQLNPGCVNAGNFTSCSPAQLGFSAITEPGSGTNGGVSALSNIIDTTGAVAATLHVTCTQGNFSVNIQTYAEDGTTTLPLITPVSAIAANANVALSIGEQANPTANTGTVSTTAILRLPQKAISISTTNASVTAGTCTARLLLSYH
jgi:hypothetical protein